MMTPGRPAYQASPCAATGSCGPAGLGAAAHRPLAWAHAQPAARPPQAGGVLRQHGLPSCSMASQAAAWWSAAAQHCSSPPAQEQQTPLRAHAHRVPHTPPPSPAQGALAMGMSPSEAADPGGDRAQQHGGCRGRTPWPRLTCCRKGDAGLMVPPAPPLPPHKVNLVSSQPPTGGEARE